MHLRIALLALVPFAAGAANEPPPLPPASVTLQVDASSNDPLAWRMTVRNEGNVPVRIAADARLLTLEIQPAEGAAPAEPKSGAKGKASDRRSKGAPEPVVCKLPAPLRPVAFMDDRAIILPPNARYDEVLNPALYCFDSRAAHALVAGATVVAKLGFPAPPPRGPKRAPLDPPFVVEPATRDASVSPIKELGSASWVLSRDVVSTDPNKGGSPTDSGLDEHAPNLELSAPARIDAESELTISIPFTIKNAGERGTTVHVRRDNLLFDVDGPDGAAHCGYASSARLVPQELFYVMRPGGSQSLDVWVGEMCPDIVFDRPGLYRIWPTLAFPNSTSAAVQNWSAPIRTREPILVRILRGRLPFYAEPPRAIVAR